MHTCTRASWAHSLGSQAVCSMEAILLSPPLLLACATLRRSRHGCQSQGAELPGQKQYVGLGDRVSWELICQ